MFDFEIKLAQSREEKEKAFRLRHEVFQKELSPAGGSAASVSALETDAYDGSCDHMIVIDKTKDIVVGTYRLLLGEKASRGEGFYSEKIFDLESMKKLGPGVMELGRSCVHKDYREGLVINLLWQGIAQYVQENNIRFLFGSVRLYTTDTAEVNEIFSMVKDAYYSADEFRVLPRDGNAFEGLTPRAVSADERKKIFLRLPPLIKGYLRLGLKICGPPAWDRHLYSVVFFVLLDMEHMSNTYKRHFLGK